jgi:hypothetical protein
LTKTETPKRKNSMSYIPTGKPNGRPRMFPDKWKAIIALRATGFTPMETKRLLNTERRGQERSYAKDVEHYLPELYDIMTVAYEDLKKKVIEREKKEYGKRKKHKEVKTIYHDRTRKITE